MCNMKALSLLLRKFWQRLKFFKVGQTSRSRSRGKKLWYHVKGLVTRNTHVQYESPITSGKKAMAKVKVFKSRSNFKVKVTRSKIMVLCERSSYNTYVQYESPITFGKKIVAKDQFFCSRTHTDTDTRVMTLASRTFVPAHLKCPF